VRNGNDFAEWLPVVGPTHPLAGERVLDTRISNCEAAGEPPERSCGSGGYIESVFQQMGIKEDAKKKASLKPMGYLVGEAVAAGEAELGLSFISEFMGKQGTKGHTVPGRASKAAALYRRCFCGHLQCGASARLHRLHHQLRRTREIAGGRRGTRHGNALKRYFVKVRAA